MRSYQSRPYKPWLISILTDHNKRKKFGRYRLMRIVKNDYFPEYKISQRLEVMKNLRQRKSKNSFVGFWSYVLNNKKVMY